MTHSQLTFRNATLKDLDQIVRLLTDDNLGKERERYETPLPECYLKAFEAIDRDPNQELMVAESENRIAGVLQLTFIPYLSYQGSWRALVESVRVSKGLRNQGIGKKLIQRAIDKARQKGCHLIQLTSNKKRLDAIRFYESLGFTASHQGMKLFLEKS